MDALVEVFAISHLFIGAGIGYVRELPKLPPQYVYKYDQNEIVNPLGTASIGYVWEPHRTLDLKLEVWRHQSFIGADDVGQDSIQFSFKWRPFRK